MVGNITVGIVVLLIVGGIIFGCRIEHSVLYFDYFFLSIYLFSLFLM